jgi:hypothetical protein
MGVKNSSRQGLERKAGKWGGTNVLLEISGENTRAILRGVPQSYGKVKTTSKMGTVWSRISGRVISRFDTALMRE